MWPTEKNGFIGNFDLEPWLPCFTKSGGTNSLCDNPSAGFIVPSNVGQTGLAVVDGAVAATQVANNKHTLKAQDLNNFAPRIGFAYAATDKLVFRGGYGMFYDRPSASSSTRSFRTIRFFAK